MDRRIDVWTNKETDGQRERQVDKPTNRHRGKQTDRKASRQTHGQSDRERQTDGWKDGWMDR